MAFEPSWARPPSVKYRLRKWLQRHQLPLSVAVVGLVIASALGVRAWQQQTLAQSSQVQARAVDRLMKDLFKGMGPDAAPTYKFTAEELLDRAHSF